MDIKDRNAYILSEFEKLQEEVSSRIDIDYPSLTVDEKSNIIKGMKMFFDILVDIGYKESTSPEELKEMIRKRFEK